jgi:hypothetical protein
LRISRLSGRQTISDREEDVDKRERDLEGDFVAFLRREGLDESPVPPELQAAVERRIDAEFAARRTIGWGSTALISGAATLVLGLANQGSFNPAFAALLALAAAIYGLGVRQLTATSAGVSELSA